MSGVQVLVFYLLLRKENRLAPIWTRLTQQVRVLEKCSAATKQSWGEQKRLLWNEFAPEHQQKEGTTKAHFQGLN